jgi:hypothetical protein
MTNTATLQKLATNPEKVSVWSVRPFQIVSLWECTNFAPICFFAIANAVENVRSGAFMAATHNQKKAPEVVMKEEPDVLRTIAKHCDEAGLETVQPHIKRMLENYAGKYGDYDTTRMDADYRELHWRVQDEMATILVMRIPRDRAIL